MSRIYRVAPDERVEGQPTSGMVREQAVATDRMWGGFVTTEARMASGWHHHGSHETTIYVLSGVLRMEWGPGGGQSLEAGPGDFIYVGKDLIHRESNPSPERSSFVVVRSGEGEVVVNVEGPDED
jgi:uncharacterized RmlC-like cupin family protein